MQIRTHETINTRLCGRPLEVTGHSSRVVLETDDGMAVDAKGLVHGGFVFGLADHAAMIAVNHPNVVLGASSVRFLKPIRVGDTVTAVARVDSEEGKKRRVLVDVVRGEERVMEGEFTCFVLDNHVLS